MTKDRDSSPQGLIRLVKERDEHREKLERECFYLVLAVVILLLTYCCTCGGAS